MEASKDSRTASGSQSRHKVSSGGSMQIVAPPGEAVRGGVRCRGSAQRSGARWRAVQWLRLRT